MSTPDSAFDCYTDLMEFGSAIAGPNSFSDQTVVEHWLQEMYELAVQGMHSEGQRITVVTGPLLRLREIGIESK